jgi:hypothetical protein
VVERANALQDLDDGLHVLVLCVETIVHELTFFSPYSNRGFPLDGIAGSITIAILNYILLGFQFPVDGFYLHSFEIWLATTIVFFGSGNVGFTLLEYRLGKSNLFWGFLENMAWVPFLYVTSLIISTSPNPTAHFFHQHNSFFFFGGLPIPLSQAILAHLFSYNITWGATKKEVERSNFFKEIPKITKRFWFPLTMSIVLIAGIIIVSTPLVPVQWRVGSEGWAVIFPLAYVFSSQPRVG